MSGTHTGIVVDDNQDLVEAVSEFLEHSGFSIVGNANNGHDASVLYEKMIPDFVVLDTEMPQYDGTYAIKEIKKINPTAKIFVVTGSVDQNFQKNEVIEVFEKPCNLYKMVKSIKTSLINE